MARNPVHVPRKTDSPRRPDQRVDSSAHAVSAAKAVADFATPAPLARRARHSRPVRRAKSPDATSYDAFFPLPLAAAWRAVRADVSALCEFFAHRVSRVWAVVRPFALVAPSLRVTVLASSLLLAIVISASVVTSEIDLTPLLPGAAPLGRPRLVVLNDKLLNQGDAPAQNVEITRPRYRLVGTLSAGEAIPVPSADFAVQYEWNENDKLRLETRSFRTATSAASDPRSARQTASPPSATLHLTPTRSPYSQAPDPASGAAAMGLAATYDPATRLLTVTADRLVEVRVDGFLLRPISRTDRDGGEYRFSQANILVLGQDLKRGETTVFEVVFTRPQDFYSIPIYVREPGGPASYFTVTTSVAARP